MYITRRASETSNHRYLALSCDSYALVGYSNAFTKTCSWNRHISAHHTTRMSCLLCCNCHFTVRFYRAPWPNRPPVNAKRRVPGTLNCDQTSPSENHITVCCRHKERRAEVHIIRLLCIWSLEVWLYKMRPREIKLQDSLNLCGGASQGSSQKGSSLPQQQMHVHTHETSASNIK